MTQQLPPGWATQFDQQSQRWFFIDTSTGHTQWEQPSFANLGNYNSTSITQPVRMAPQNFTNPFESPAGVPSQYYAQSAGPTNTFASNSTSHADQHPQYVEGKKTKEHLVEPEKKEGKSKSSMGKLMVGAMIGLPITSLIRSQKKDKEHKSHGSHSGGLGGGGRRGRRSRGRRGRHDGSDDSSSD